MLNFSNAIECASSDSHILAGNIELYIVSEEVYCMPDFERIDEVEKDIQYLLELYSKVVIRQAELIEDCAETFSVISSHIQMNTKASAEIYEELKNWLKAHKD